MPSRLRTLVLATTLLLSVALWVIPANAGTYDNRTFIDNWNTWDYNGNDGTHKFNGPWTETGDDGRSNGGFVYAGKHSYCPTGSYCLTIGSDEQEFGSGLGAQRYADTANAESVKLCFEYRGWLDEVDDLSLKVQVNGGSGWVTVDTITLDEGLDGSSTHWEKDITGHAAKNMGIRFLTSGSGGEGFIFIDTVEVQATINTEPTTTTTTTTTVPATTTTTVPVTTTTTVPVTTTTVPATTTTTTTTTSQPGGTTTTTGVDLVTTTGAPPAATTTTTAAPTQGTTTTTVDGASVAPPPPDGGAGNHQEPLPLTPAEVADYSSKVGMSLDDSMPMLMVPDMGTATSTQGSTSDSSSGVDRTATQGLMATFSTSTETLQAHGISVVLLGLLVAWLAVRGLGRSRWGGKDPADASS